MLGMPKIVGYLLRKAAIREWNGQRERNVLQSKKLKEAGDVKQYLTLDMEIEFGDYPADFSVCMFRPVFPYHVLFPMICNDNSCDIICRKYVIFLFSFY